LGIPALLPFIKAVCQSKKSWQARHTGIKIVQQISVLMGVAVLPYLKSLVDIIADGLKDPESKVRIMTALSIAALAEASTPYGIESFDSILKPLWIGIQKHKGKPLAAFLKAIGYIIPLMSAEHAAIYTRNVMDVLIREFSSQDPEMQKIVLKVVKQCVTTEGIEAKFVKEKIITPFFQSFWDRKMALDRRSSRPLIETTVSLAENVGASEIILKIVKDLKNESEPFRKMTIETIEKIVETLGSADIDKRLEYELVDGILHTFQELHSEEDSKFVIRAFGTIINSLGVRVKQYLSSIVATIKWRLDHKSPTVRQQAADLIGMIAPVMKKCDDEKRLAHFGQILYEYLGEEYPDVLGSILFALGKVLDAIGTDKMTPPIKDLLPRLTPILKNRHEKVQENTIVLVGKIANKAPEHVAAKEWMRICFDLLDVLKAHRKSIRRAAIFTFGYIAKSIGPHDVLATLLNNLKVQERQNRVCTTIAIAIVSENCGIFTVLPALMNEYKVPELNVQTGVLKSLSFMFEHVGEMSKDYIYAVVPLLEDALMDRDLVHRQTACTVVKHLALGVYGLGCEDALIHLLNLVWPNIFETSPHVINAVMEAIEGLRVGLGSPIISLYTLQGLFHPARKVRNVYWKIFNNLYIGQADSLIACYPNVPNDKEGHYQRDELMMFL
jgi:splicing factor 3B subunit 1